ncbi:MAG: zinc metalloprotease [Armatimonadota bacterium]|nr:zinc metalloprotease [Armatimonadota bacterium]
MVLKNVWIFAGALTLAVPSVMALSLRTESAQSAVYEPVDVCATQNPSQETLNALEKLHDSTEGGIDSQVVIPVVFHVINRGVGIENGDVPESMLLAQINVLNTAFSGGAGGSNTDFRFELAGITRTTNAAWYTCAYHSPEEYAMKEALRQGDAGTLNIYTTNSPWNWGGFPWLYQSAPLHDGPVVRHAVLAGAGDPYFGSGHIAVHEVGHWMGLYHTFQGECSKNNDFVADTPAMRVGGPQNCAAPRDTCTGRQYPGTDPLNNYMTGTIDSCTNQFTVGQASRMAQMWAMYRQ